MNYTYYLVHQNKIDPADQKPRDISEIARNIALNDRK